MINKYKLFIAESKFDEYKKEYHSIGEWIEEVSKDDDYLQSIISNYIHDIDTDINISNAVNMLQDFDLKQLFYRIYNYINNGEKEKDVDIMANVEITENVKFGGKNMLQSFLKSLTGLGLKESFVSESKNNFFLFYTSKNVSVLKLKTVFNRFRSLSMFIDRIKYDLNDCDVYYGIKQDMVFEYGFLCDNEEIKIGSFKINKSTLKSLLLLQSPSALPLKRDILSLDFSDLVLLCTITREMQNYKLSSKSKGPILKDGVLSFGYYGVGKWDNDVLDEGEYYNIRNNFKNWLIKFKWSDKILVSITHNEYWIYLNFKIK
jgi:hypothetical protein